MKKRVFYSDTDSCYVDVNCFVKEKERRDNIEFTKKEKVDFIKKAIDKVFFPTINNTLNEICGKLNTYENNFKMAHEKTCEKILFSQKKKYIMFVAEKEGKFYDKSKFEFKGIEIVRTSTPQVVRNLLTKTIEFIFSDSCKNVSDLSSYVRGVKGKWKNYSIKEIAFPRGVSDMTRYKPEKSMLGIKMQKGTPVAVKAAWVYNIFIKQNGYDKEFPTIVNKDKIKWVYLKKQNPFNSQVIGFTDSYYFPEDAKYDLEKYVDRDKQFYKSYFDVVKNLVEAIGWKLTINQQATLFTL